MPLLMRFRKMIFLVSDLSKYNAFPAYSPMPFGVKIEAVNAASTCFVASPIDIGRMDETKFCHFKISKKRFKTLNDNKNKIPRTDQFLSNFSAKRSQSSRSLFASWL